MEKHIIKFSIDRNYKEKIFELTGRAYKMFLNKVEELNLYQPTLEILTQDSYQQFPIDTIERYEVIVEVVARKRTEDDYLRECTEYKIKNL